jgi:hypothetical protein
MRVIFIDQTKRYRSKLEKYVWWGIGLMALTAFGIFVFRPDLLLVP